MWELNYKESWVPKNLCFWTVALEKTPESPLDYKKIQPVHPKGIQSGIFIGRTDVEAETPILWPPDAKNWLIGKDLDPGKDWKQEEKGMTEDEMVGWHHWLNGHEFEQAPGIGDGQGSLACCSPWGHKESDTTERLNWTELKHKFCMHWETKIFVWLTFLWYSLYCNGLELSHQYLLSTYYIYYYTLPTIYLWCNICLYIGDYLYIHMILWFCFSGEPNISAYYRLNIVNE